jgi:Mannosyl-glycoprotein endo-beta-N-acetylglucosaminidase
MRALPKELRCLAVTNEDAVRTLLALLLVVVAETFPNASLKAEEWGCYDPQPGHPTAAEKQIFVSELCGLAPAAESKYGVPASALASIAIVESGYGWTRTAQQANNLFCWKFVSRRAARGRVSYTLERQPPEDKNNGYVTFANHIEAVDFVGKKLATLPIYKSATDECRRSRTSGADIPTITRTWVTAVAQQHNWKPQQYVESVTRTINNPISPSDTVSAELSLYQLSQIRTAEDRLGSGIGYIAYAEQKIVPWKSAHCDPPRLDYPRWTGFPVTLCDYSDIGVTVRTYMLNADRAKQAHWTVTACQDAKATNMHACIDYMVGVVRRASSGGVFPVAGYVPEPQNGGVCYVFRDGITVWTTLRPYWQRPQNHSCGNVDESEQPLAAVWKFARIASTTLRNTATLAERCRQTACIGLTLCARFIRRHGKATEMNFCRPPRFRRIAITASDQTGCRSHARYLFARQIGSFTDSDENVLSCAHARQSVPGWPPHSHAPTGSLPPALRLRSSTIG